MSTLRQKKLAKALVDNLGSRKNVNKKDLLVSVGYPESTATTYPQTILEQKGVKEELKALGFDEITAKAVVSQILTNVAEESKDRLKAAEMVFKVHGSFKESEKPVERVNTVYNFIFSPDVQKDVKEIEAKIKAKLISTDVVKKD